MNTNFIKGIPASYGTVTGRLMVIESTSDINRIINGEIILVEKSSPIYTTLFSKIKGIISESGGQMSHLAIVAREAGIPCVFGVKDARNFLTTGMIVTINGKDGHITIE